MTTRSSEWFRRIAVAACCSLGGPALLAADLVWETHPGHRRALLQPSARSRQVGFTRIPGEQSGVNFTNHLAEASAAQNRIYENGSGVALGDVDGDGWCDLYFCRLEGPNVLYRNLGNWQFSDVTAAAGAGVACADQYSTGAALVDIDGDRDLDLLVTSIGHGTRLFLNDSRGVFAAAPDSGLVAKGGATSLALADLDGDTDLEIYTAYYRTTTYKDAPPGVKAEVFLVDGRVVVTPEDRFEGIRYKGGGMGLIEKGEPDMVYVNKGNGRFGRISWVGGAFVDAKGNKLTAPPLDWGLSVLFRDLNGDRAPDLYVCNDFSHSRDRIWINEAGRRFRALSPYALRTLSMSSMGADVADINRDGFDDIVVVDMLSRDLGARQRQRANTLKGRLDLPLADPEYQPDTPRNTLHLNRGDGTYAEIAQLSGLDASEWSWSAVFLDVDLDGYEDLLVTNGNNHDSLDADLLKEIAKPPDQVSALEHYQNLSKFPRLHATNLVFRNRGDLTFEEVGAAWGFNTSGISHGMALADLDLDGDLDAVVNQLHAEAGLYRNDTTAPRVAVRLRGLGGNTRGIGARITLSGGAVAEQSQEMICGGRYLSSDEAIRVFAAGTNRQPMSLEVRWRQGGRTLLSNVVANAVYEIEEPANRSPLPPAPPRPVALFEDVSARLNHVHRDEAYDDWARQPTLSRGLSHLGPGTTWYDVNGDGWDDLIVGAGRSGTWTLFENDRTGGFKKITPPAFADTLRRDQTTLLGWSSPGRGRGFLVGQSSYEELTPKSGDPEVRFYPASAERIETLLVGSGVVSVGPMAMADIDADGTLDLFVGGRVVPGRYPEEAPSRLLRGRGDSFAPAGDDGLNRTFARLGLVSGATFADFDLDGYPDLLVACEWGPLRLFRNTRGQWHEATQAAGLAPWSGWWNGVAVGDFDEDGRLDFCASNWGRNTKYQPALAQKVQVLAADFNGDGTWDIVEHQFDPALGKRVPVRDYDTLCQALPELRGRITRYRDFGQAAVAEILGAHAAAAREWSVTTLDSTVFLNRGERFEPRPLPVQAQFAPAYGVSVADFDGDGHDDLFLAQNDFDVEPDTSRYDAGIGLCLLGDGRGGFRPLSGEASGLRLYGQQRGSAVSDYDGDGRPDLVVGQNRSTTGLFRNRQGRPGLRVRLTGPSGNPMAVGATVRWIDGERSGKRNVVCAGSGYWSQASAVTLLTAMPSGAEIEVTWPGGKRTRSRPPAGARELLLQADGSIGRTPP